jgi:mannosyltransferase OCH1-like enzyme
MILFYIINIVIMIKTVKKHENSTIQENKQKRLAKFYKNSKNKPNNVDGPTNHVVTQVYRETLPMPIKPKTINVPVVNVDVVEKTKPRIIPLNIFQTWYTLDLPPKMKANVELLKKQNPEFTHYLYDDKMCIDFIREYFDDSVIWAFDKLKPGAYKADLWRYCVLYIHGGIYLDIKMKPVNIFKLIQLTDQEYFPKDRFSDNIHGIWQGLLVCLPHNIILHNSIMLICQNVKNNFYGPSALSITGPHMICNFIKLCNIQNSPIRFDIDYNSVASNTTSMLYLNRKLILRNYEEYRNDSIYSINRSHYSWLWTNVNIYNYPILLPKYTKEITKSDKTKFNTFFSGTPTIIQDPNNSNQYIVNLRWINYNYNENGSKDVIPKQWVSLNSRFTVDNLFEKISNEIDLTENYEIEKNFISRGIEDIRIIKFNDKHFYLATRFNPILKRPYVCSNEYIIDDTEYNLNKTYINPTFYNVNKTIKAEKNWAMFEYKTKLSVVYDWYPLQIGCINYNTHELGIIETKTDMPEFFQNARGSTIGCHFENEIWFVLHKAQNNRKLKTDNPIFNYQHFFAVFDLNMNLKRHSELFKLGDKMVEFCTGLIMEEERLILSYSLLDTHSYVSTYDYDIIHNSIKWYKY